MDDMEHLRDENARLRDSLARLEARLRALEGDGFDLDAVFPAFPALLFLFSEDDRYLDYRAGEGLFASPETFLGRRIDEVLPTPLGANFRAAMAAAREAGTVQVVEYSLPLPVGERHFEARLLALADRRLVILATDVTERRNAQETVRRQEAQLAQLTARSPSVLYSLALGPKGPTVSSVSANLERLLGYTAAELDQPGWWAERVHPEDRERATASAASVVTEGQVTHTYRFRHQDGTWRWIRDELRLVRDGEGRPSELVGSFSDVTVQREAEEALRRSDERYRAIIERTSDALLVVDGEARITWASPATRQVYGMDPEELIGQSSLDLVHPEDRRRLGETPEEVRARRAGPGVLRRDEVRVRHRDGTWRLVQAETRNLLHLPAVQGIVVTVRDVTEQRRLEQQYLQSQKLESVGRLAGGIAHDFNNLLIGILGYADLLEEGLRAGRPSLEDLGEIRKAGERARDLTAQLLAVARRQVSEPRVMELNDLLRDSEKLLRRVLGEDIDLSVQLEPRAWKVKVDPTNLQQVVLNLAVNARDAMPRGGKLTIETANVQLDEQYALGHEGVPPGPYVLLAISDSGQGMSSEVQAHAFEPFFTTKAAGAGTGLGLATVYGIVKQAGGHIWLYSEPGRGTTFKIYLPRTDEAAVGRPPRPPAATRRGSETILVVEDEAPARALVARVLTEAGYHVLPAGGGSEALDLAARHEAPIDLLLTDVVMPGLSGKQVADTLAAARPGLRVLYTSGYTQNTIVHHGVLDPEVRFLAKPFTPSTLLERVRAVLDEP